MTLANIGQALMAGLVAAATIILVLLFLTGLLRYISIAGLGAVLIMASMSLLNVRTLCQFYWFNRFEFTPSRLAGDGEPG